MLPRDAHPLREELLSLFQAGADAPLDNGAFDRLALRVFAFTFSHVPAYAAYCRARGARPGTVERWTAIPAVPTAAFKELTLLAAGATAERVFRTSGTTRGPERRGAHAVADLALYRASLRSTFETYLLPDGARPRILSLMPPEDALPDSSLAFMLSDVLRAFGPDGSAVFADADGLDYDRLDRSLERSVSADRPVLLLGTSAAFIHWLDRWAEGGRAVRLPTGSRLMDTGGFKGRGRDVPPEALRVLYRERLGIPGYACVNEYGMTEMLSQLYDTALRDRVRALDRPVRKQGPPWVRSVAVDPETLDPLPDGDEGLLRHIDLANLGGVAAIQTEDLGRVDQDGVSLTGRRTGAPPRGCSIAMDLILERGS